MTGRAPPTCATSTTDAPGGRGPDRRGTTGRDPNPANPIATLRPDAHPHLFPALTGNAGGQRAMTYYSYRVMLNRWLQICDIRDEHGDPVHLTLHQWRHTFASRLINQDVPQEVIRVLLDHESTEMTCLLYTSDAA